MKIEGISGRTERCFTSQKNKHFLLLKQSHQLLQRGCREDAWEEGTFFSGPGGFLSGNGATHAPTCHREAQIHNDSAIPAEFKPKVQNPGRMPLNPVPTRPNAINQLQPLFLSEHIYQL